MLKITKDIIFKKSNKPILIAEISGNHGGSKKRFLQLIKSAYENGADIVKIQSYEPKDITLGIKNESFRIKKGIWKNKYLWDLYKQAHTPFKWHSDAFKLAKLKKKIIFSSPFSIRAVDMLEKLNVKLYKISSFEITDFKLIDYIASKNKPIILSTGMAELSEVKKAIKCINKYHNKIIILHCVSGYPTKLSDSNLIKIKFLQKHFKNNLVGLSDHTNNIISSIASYPLGVVAIEKHFTLNKKFSSADKEFSIDPTQLKKLSVILKDLQSSFNNQENKNIEYNSKKLRRSIFAKKNIRKGEKFDFQNIDTLRPKIGICASQFFKIIKKRAKKSIKSGSPIFKNQILMR